jgi:predicted adenylyl cyclase CyaB
MVNIEIKARCADLNRAEDNLSALGAGPAGSFRQRDTYFRCPAGRLKLRELNPQEGYLIFYQRDDTPGPKRSDYHIAATSDPESLRTMLSQVLGVGVEVTKTRQVWLWENVRIHLDEVDALGSFLELEAVTDGASASESQARVEALMRALEIGPEHLVCGSYGDLIAK